MQAQTRLSYTAIGRYLTPMGVVLLLSIGALPPPQIAAAQQTKPSVQNLPSFYELTEKMRPIVVNISTTQSAARGQSPTEPFGGNDQFNEFWRRFFGEPFGGPGGPGEMTPRRGLGSGFIIDSKGLVVTNNHVVENAEQITVKLDDEKEFPAEVVGRDPKTDIAVIRMKGGTENLKAAPLGDSAALRVGDWVVAMGSPFGLQNTVTAGIVSAKDRNIGAGPYDAFIQTDASINPGNSGGPLINLAGQVIGINTAIFSRTGGNLGIGFAIPINLVKDVVPQLIEKGRVTRGWLGVAIQQVTPGIAQSLKMEKAHGALVANVTQGSPAAQAGIKVGDVIVEYNGKPIQDANALPILVARTEVGKSANLTVLRDNKSVALNVTIAELKEEEVVASSPEKGKLGLAVQNLTPEMAGSLGLGQTQGVIVTAVQAQSPAAEAGIQRGDIILEVNRKSIQNTSEFQSIVNDANSGANLLFLVRRGGNNLFLALTRPDGRG